MGLLEWYGISLGHAPTMGIPKSFGILRTDETLDGNPGQL